MIKIIKSGIKVGSKEWIFEGCLECCEKAWRRYFSLLDGLKRPNIVRPKNI